MPLYRMTALKEASLPQVKGHYFQTVSDIVMGFVRIQYVGNSLSEMMISSDKVSEQFIRFFLNVNATKILITIKSHIRSHYI